MNLFRAAHGQGADWHAACQACLEQLAPLPPGANLGFVYASDPLAEALDLIVAHLRKTTSVADWVGTGGAGVCATGREFFDRGALVVLVAALPAGSYRLFDDLVPDNGAFEVDAAASAVGFGVVHGDPRQRSTPELLARLSERSGAFLVGGLSSAGNPMQIAGQPTESALSGVLIDPQVPVIAGLSQGCVPIGPVHEVTGCGGAWVAGLDGRPALEVLKQEIGDVLARQLDRVGGDIHAALPVAGSDRADYVVRNLLGVDLERRSVALGQELREGDRLLFVKRDGGTAQADLRRMLDDLRTRADGRPIRGALYHSCIARGPNTFGPDSAKLRAIHEVLGPVPLAGFFTNGEIFWNRLYAYTGVLTLFL
ncbi:MAG: FIST signal transduction protein [Geminicoccaceae bacterium]